MLPSRCKLQLLSRLQPAVFCLSQGVSEQAMVQVIAPAVKPLVSDRASAVKEQCFAAVGSWLGASRSVPSLGALFTIFGSLFHDICDLHTAVDVQACRQGRWLTTTVISASQVSHRNSCMASTTDPYWNALLLLLASHTSDSPG